jgi:hypothetical protein
MPIYDEHLFDRTIMDKLHDMHKFVSSHSPRSRPNESLVHELKEILSELMYNYARSGKDASVHFFEGLRIRLSSAKTNSKVKIILEELLTLPYGRVNADRISADRLYPLKRKISDLDKEILRLSSNPALEEKMDILEEELLNIKKGEQNLKEKLEKSKETSELIVKITELERKMQAFSSGYESGEKKYEDVLKAYKEAKKDFLLLCHLIRFLMMCGKEQLSALVRWRILLV